MSVTCESVLALPPTVPCNSEAEEHSSGHLHRHAIALKTVQRGNRLEPK